MCRLANSHWFEYVSGSRSAKHQADEQEVITPWQTTLTILSYEALGGLVRNWPGERIGAGGPGDRRDEDFVTLGKLSAGNSLTDH